jgi:hypothetical protein
MYSTKKCSCCQLEKNESSFGFKNKKLGKLQSKCKQCQAIYHKKHYETNKQKYLNKSKKNNKIYKANNKIFIDQYKESKGCKFCNEKCAVCLDFHHEDPIAKEMNVSRMKNSSHSIKTITREISKCIVICSNCHRKLHAGLII